MSITKSIPRFDEFYYFPSAVYCIECPEFLDSVNKITDEYLTKVPVNKNELYPIRQTENFSNNQEIKPFTDFIVDQSTHILDSQGYRSEIIQPFVDSMWSQEHHKFSLMETHVHNWNTLVGFYFLKVPENSSRAVFHDPRPGKVMTNLVERDPSVATLGSDMINFEPKSGLMILSNAWLPHSFTRHGNEEIMTFVHFNVSIQYKSFSNPIII